MSHRFLVEIIEYELMNNNPYTPYKATKDSAGYDLCCPKDLDIPANTKTRISLDLKLFIPSHLYGLLTARSSIAYRGLKIDVGIIDPDFNGIIQASVFNTLNEVFRLHRGERFCQIVFNINPSIALKPKIADTSLFNHVDEINNELDAYPTRNLDGFGSTGSKHQKLN